MARQKKIKRGFEQIRLRGNHGARESDDNLQHDAHLKDKDLSVKSLVKEGFSNMLAKHAATNTVTSMQGTGALWLKTGAVGSHLLQL